MIAKQSLWLHGGLFVLASALGLFAITKEDEDPRAEHEVALWSADAKDVQRVSYQSKTKSVVLEGQSDAVGRYFVATVEKEKRKPPKNPHQLEASADAGAPPAGEQPEEKPERETVRFIAVDEANEFAANVAKLMAKRALGKVPEDRFEEFGFDPENKSTLELSISGTVRQLTVGGKTPGGGDVYVRDDKSGEGYVIAGSIATDLQNADASLLERQFVDLEDAELGRLVIAVGEARRELVPVPDNKQYWANPSDPATKDETASNWITKFNRLRASEYVEKVEGELVPVASVEYFGKDNRSLGKVELVSQTLPGEEKPRYLARSATTRWYAVVLASIAEAVAQDAASIANP